jgi:hypothetical protein
MQQIVEQMPEGAVALNVWRAANEYGPDPITLVVSRESYDKFRKRVESISSISPDTLYIFESPLAPDGRKTVSHLTRIVGVMAYVNTKILPVQV